ncbi:hypothetical protein HAX54_033985, partial [Datura stramonium]|nr:hypothetical protein [Datura stramonium]
SHDEIESIGGIQGQGYGNILGTSGHGGTVSGGIPTGNTLGPPGAGGNQTGDGLTTQNLL